MGKLFDLAIAEVKNLPESEQERIGHELYTKLDPAFAPFVGSVPWDVPDPNLDDESQRTSSVNDIWAVRNLDAKRSDRISGSNRLVSIRIAFHLRQFGVILSGAEFLWRRPGNVDPVLWFWKGNANGFEKLFGGQ